MKFPLAFFLALLISGCHDAPQAPPCRAAPEEKPPLYANAGCLIMKGDALLVLKHRFGGKLGIPGGAAREGETAQCTAHRETWEETGLDVQVGRRVGRLRYGFTLYRCYPSDQDTAEGRPHVPWHAWPEITGVLWLPPDQIPLDQWRYEEQAERFMDIVRRLTDSDDMSRRP